MIKFPTSHACDKAYFMRAACSAQGHSRTHLHSGEHKSSPAPAASDPPFPTSPRLQLLSCISLIMSSPILGNSPSLHEHNEGEQIRSQHMPLEEHGTGLLQKTPTNLDSVVPNDGDSIGWLPTEYLQKVSNRKCRSCCVCSGS